MAADSKSQVTYQRFLEFESLVKKYPSSEGQPYNAAPIGFCAFALTLFVYSMNIAGATVPVNTSPSMAMGLALFYGGLIQFLAGLFELRIGNNYHALLFCSYSGYWFGLGALYASTFSFYSFVGDTTVQYKALGIFYLGWTIFTLVMLIASIRTNVVMIVFFFFLMLTYILLTASYFLLWDQNTARAGGAIGIFTSVILWYAGFASLLKKGDNSYFNLPVFSLAPKDRANSNAKSAVEVRVQNP
ncbi:unnamed protein product [Rotaria magnacalcarata]|uniref:Uncharacterized protein n=3 Tax=Rotaria magnacalcarata TaxID=392030 RepID=A0A814GUM7_9BILA|nr:unnamed protein product [Rotaria magnacalcarata]CAF1239877.1 unnamed protein product [Rotaria magnacalcarata]CAF2083841.1 unnamed protein product [Rotaria magnacalcarata]CAF3908460.1 unnamed protein product [Rotaria magnacalcarata]CAF3964109.1 unnamed protein product [Rotaria magnacalcarata]